MTTQPPPEISLFFSVNNCLKTEYNHDHIDETTQS